MFKNETVVKAALVALLLIFGITLGAETNPPARGSESSSAVSGLTVPSECNALKIKVEALERRLARQPGNANTIEPQIDTALNEVTECVKNAARNGNVTNSCQNNASEYKKALEDANNCQGFRKSGDSDNIGCGHAVTQCQCLDMDDGEKAKIPVCENVPNGKGKGMAALERRFNACPEEAGRDLDKLENEVKDMRKNVRDLQEKISAKKKQEKQEAKQDKQDKNAARQKMKQVRDQMAQELEKHGEKLKENKRAQEAARAELQKQVFELQEELTRIREKEWQVANKRRDAQAKYHETETALRLNCNKKAVDEVNQLQQVETAKVVANIRNLGGFNALMKQVNRPERQQWKEVARQRYTECVRDQNFRETLRVAQVQLINQHKILDGEEAKLEEDKRNVQKRIDKIRNGGSCSNYDQTAHNGDTPETGMCEARRKAIEDSILADNIFRVKMKNLQADAADARAEMAEAAQQGATGNFMTPDDIGPLLQDLADEKQRLADAENLLRIKKAIAGGKQMDQKTFNEVTDRIEKLKIAAQRFVGCQTRPVTDGEGRTTRPTCADDCDRAARYLRSVGGLTQDEFDAIPRSSGTNGEQRHNLNPTETTRDR